MGDLPKAVSNTAPLQGPPFQVSAFFLPFILSPEQMARLLRASTPSSWEPCSLTI